PTPEWPQLPPFRRRARQHGRIAARLDAAEEVLVLLVLDDELVAPCQAPDRRRDVPHNPAGALLDTGFARRKLRRWLVLRRDAELLGVPAVAAPLAMHEEKREQRREENAVGREQVPCLVERRRPLDRAGVPPDDEREALTERKR